MKATVLFRFACAAAFGMIAAATGPVRADSFTSSASSNSSNRDKRVAAGDYKVIDVAQAPTKADTTRLTLRPASGTTTQDFTLDVPNRALAARAIDAGAMIHVNERVYGYEFAYADTRQPFFLALQDGWYRELGSRQVTI
jgi:hypothetical protein